MGPHVVRIWRPHGPPQGQQRWTWLRLSAQLADCLGWSKFYHAPAVAAAHLQPCPEDEASTTWVHQEGAVVEGPAGGYKAQLADGVDLQIRYIRVGDAIQTQYRI